MSAGHVVMIVAGLLATLLTYSVLRQAGGRGTDVLVASRTIRAGETASPAILGTTSVKASGTTLTGILRAGSQNEVVGKVAAVDIPQGQLLAGSQFRAATPPPPSMAIPVDPQAIPGGASSLVAGSHIDIVASTPAGLPYVIPGLEVLRPPDVPKGGQIGSSSTVRIDVAVRDDTTEKQIQAALQGGKFMIRVTAPGG